MGNSAFMIFTGKYGNISFIIKITLSKFLILSLYLLILYCKMFYFSCTKVTLAIKTPKIIVSG